ncbi:lysophospholipid acyltransferase family protein [Pilimelia anulata]|uniref:lysophospholipid acyltransferase family protein n=1 Tax=Pilimelia anulata TaxID=53371 RepID=UPI001E384E88|nr:lysophospholipid acyltransferase family protein [Pilimelia anulata]
MSVAPAGHAPGGGSLWLPRSSCGAGCRAGSAPAPGRGGWRLLALAGVLLVTLPLLAPMAVPRWRPALVGRWARAVLRALGVRLTVRGRAPRGAALLVANHVSWLDVVALLAVVPAARLIAKREVRDWPLLGWLAVRGGTLFLDRSRPRLLPGVVAAVADRLRSGAPVACFPEGTTWCGPVGGRFRPALFQAALDAGVPVLPVRVRYAAADGPTREPAFIGEDSFVDSLRRVAGGRALAVSLTLQPALYPTPEADRRALSATAEAAVHLAVAA